MDSPSRANTSASPPPCRAFSRSRCQVTRAPTRSAVCSASRLRPAAASTRPMSWNMRVIGSVGAAGSAILAANWCTASLAA